MATKLEIATEPPASKKIKLIDNNTLSESIHVELKDLSTFTPQKILNNNSSRKTVCLQGLFGDSKDAGLVILEKTAFEENNLTQDTFFTNKSSLKKLFHNDVYGNYECFPTVELNAIKTTIIHPATEKHIKKFSIQNTHIINETPEIYKNVILPHINKEEFDLQWVYNILEHKSEKERIVFEDSDLNTGFVLLPDLKWNGTTLETLYLLAIVSARDLRSLRDLTDKHLPLLKNIYEKGTKIIKEKYNLEESQLRIYFHYHPSFYHLHVHFTYLKYEAPGILAERAHLLSNVISNIELKPDYYQNVTLPFVLRESEKIFQALEGKGIVKRLLPSIKEY